MKKLYSFILKTFLPLFLMTFGICLFIVLIQFIWRYRNDLVGKGLGIATMGELFVYAALYVVNLALPLTFLLSSLMTFGNLGERLELLAMKAAGVPLTTIMKPLMVFVFLSSIGAFFYQNNVMPKVQVKLFTLLYSAREKSPALDIPEGSFYSDIPGYTLFVSKKDFKTDLLKEVMIYDYSEGFENAMVVVADSARLSMSENKLFLKMKLFNGESFRNLESKRNLNNGEMVPYMRESFSEKEVLIDFDSNFNLINNQFIQDDYLSMNLDRLKYARDSLSNRTDSVNNVIQKGFLKKTYWRTLENVDAISSNLSSEKKEVNKITESEIDSIFNKQDFHQQLMLVERAKNHIENDKSEFYFQSIVNESDESSIRRYKIEIHKKFTLSLACLVFFFIGAPLGSIIRKGGFGTPVVISVLFFIFYYIVDNSGFRMARVGHWSPWFGTWISTIILFPLGAFLTLTAVNDAAALKFQNFGMLLKKFFGLTETRSFVLKDIIIENPDYEQVQQDLADLKVCTTEVLRKRFVHDGYFLFWAHGGQTKVFSDIRRLIEEVLEELANDSRILVVNKLMDFPVLNDTYLSIIPKKKLWSSLLCVVFPIGIFPYIIYRMQTRSLRHDMRLINKVCGELEDLLKNN